MYDMRVCTYVDVGIHVLLCISFFLLSYDSTVENSKFNQCIRDRYIKKTPNSNPYIKKVTKSPHSGSGSRKTSPTLFVYKVKTLNRTNKSMHWPDTGHPTIQSSPVHR